MTIAIDIRTGAVVGQVCAVRADRPWYPQVDCFGTPLADPSPLPVAVESVELLTRDGYLTVPRSSVRLEELR